MFVVVYVCSLKVLSYFEHVNFCLRLSLRLRLGKVNRHKKNFYLAVAVV